MSWFIQKLSAWANNRYKGGIYSHHPKHREPTSEDIKKLQSAIKNLKLILIPIN